MTILILMTNIKILAQVKLNINNRFQIGYANYTPILIGPASSFSASDGKWGIEYWSDFGGLNFWIPSPNPGAGNNFLFLQDVTGNVGIGTNKITINGAEYNAGIYLYSLIVDNQKIDTKRLVITK